MIFGDHVTPADSCTAAQWIAPAIRGVSGTVGALVPNLYPTVLRVSAPDPLADDWWLAYRHLYEIVASVGDRHTATSDRAWFAVWLLAGRPGLSGI